MEVSTHRLKQEAVKNYGKVLSRSRSLLFSRTIGSNAQLREYVLAAGRENKNIVSHALFKDLVRDALKNDIILFGNFRNDNNPRNEFLKLVKELFKEGSKVCIALDWIPFSKKKALDDYKRRNLSRGAFLRKVFGSIPKDLTIATSYFAILDFARKSRMALLPLDLENFGKGDLAKQDLQTAGRLVCFHEKNRQAKLLVLAPDSWLAESHLPSQIKSFMSTKENGLKILKVFSGSDDVYLKLACKGNENKIFLVKTDSDSYAYNLNPPLARNNSFLNWLDGEEEISDYKRRYEGFYRILSEVNRKLGLQVDLRSLKYRLFTNYEIGFIEHILGSEFLDKKEKEKILKYVGNGESYFIPFDQTIYLANLSKIHAAEEASHYLRYILAGIEKPKSQEDNLYTSIINEALAFMASKAVVPYRKPLRSGVGTGTPGGEKHTEEREAFTIHSLGYALGEKLYRKFKSGMLAKKNVREILGRRITGKGQAKAFYDSLLDLART